MPSRDIGQRSAGMRLTRREALLRSAALAILPFGVEFAPAHAQELSNQDIRSIAREAYIYGFPLVDSYRIQYSYFVDANGGEYKGGWNEIHNTARVYTPDDKAIQSPNSDTPYSFVGVDLRAEPVVLTVPEIEEGRYYSIQFIDCYTFNFACVGSRATGNGAGRFLLAGPGWKGENPAGIKDVIHCETELAFLIYRTQLFGPDDISNVEKIQAGYKVEPLSAVMDKTEPVRSAIAFAPPLGRDEQKKSPKFFELLDFVLRFCPANPAEADIRAEFAKLGVGGNERFNADALSADTRRAIEGGIEDAWATFEEFKQTRLDNGEVASGDMAGSRDYLKNNYLYRMAAAVLGIYGNSKQEAMYPVYFTDADMKPMTGASRYTLRFKPDGLPPVNAFWSLTLYQLPESLLFANRLNRYLINSTMLPKLARDTDGGLTLHIQNDSPGEDKEANWLPAPGGPFFLAMRLYWPKQEALNGQWKAPAVVRMN